MAEKPLVFVLHGMGVHDKEGAWAKPYIDALDAAIQRHGYAKLAGGDSIAEKVDFQPLSYDSYFSDLLENWEKNAKEIIEAAGATEKETVENGLDWLSGASDTDDNFAWSHVVDVFLWRFSPYVRKAIKSHIGKEMAKKITERVDQSATGIVNCSVVSHSLGTAVASQVLADLANGAWTPDDPNGFDPRFFRFMTLHTVANVSKILEISGYPVYDGVVQPGPAGEESSYCRRFFNYRNQFDPFTMVKTFDPGWQSNFYNSKRVSHIHEKNVHGLDHYASHPLVHISMLRSFLGFSIVSGGEELAATQNFDDIETDKLKSAQVNKIKKAFGKTGELITDTPDLIDLMKGLTFFEHEVGQ